MRWSYLSLCGACLISVCMILWYQSGPQLSWDWHRVHQLAFPDNLTSAVASSVDHDASQSVSSTKISLASSSTSTSSTSSPDQQIVSAWPPEKDRNVSTYVNASRAMALEPPKQMLNGKELVVFVHSRPGAADQRQLIRETWATLCGNQSAVVFVVGMEPGQVADTRDPVHQEFESFQDLILIGDLVEDYYNLSLKTINMLKYIVSLENVANFTQPKFFLKTDDDVFVNVPLLQSVLSGTRNASQPMLMGRKFTNAAPIKDGKWACPPYMFSGKTYPDLLSGSGYAMSKAAASCLFREAFNVPLFHLEDVMVTGFVAEKCGIFREDDQRFFPYLNNKFDHTHILTHYTTTKWTRLFFSRLKKHLQQEQLKAS